MISPPFSHRVMMTLRTGTSRSTGGLLLPSISPRWIHPGQRSCSRCPRRAGLWWCLLQCRGIPRRKRRRSSQACGRAASSTPTLMFRGTNSPSASHMNRNSAWSFNYSANNVIKLTEIHLDQASGLPSCLCWKKDQTLWSIKIQWAQRHLVLCNDYSISQDQPKLWHTICWNSTYQLLSEASRAAKLIQDIKPESFLWETQEFIVQ